MVKTLKVSQIIVGGLVPVAAAGGARSVLGAFGAAVVIIEGVQKLFQFHKNWISYCATCDALRREQHLFDVDAGPYQATDDPARLLGERLEQLVGSGDLGVGGGRDDSAQRRGLEPEARRDDMLCSVLGSGRVGRRSRSGVER